MASPDLMVLNYFFGGVGIMLLFFRAYRTVTFGGLIFSLTLLFLLGIGSDLLAATATNSGALTAHLGQAVFAALGAGIGWSLARGAISRPPFGLGSALVLACTVRLT